MKQRHPLLTPLDMKATSTSHFNEGLMTPVSANGQYDCSRRNSDAQDMWSDSSVFHHPYTPVHPNTPVQVHVPRVTPPFQVNQYDSLRINVSVEDHRDASSLPTPTTCGSNYTGSFSFDGSEVIHSEIRSSPMAMQNCQMNMSAAGNFDWNMQLAPTQASYNNSFASSLSLSAFEDLKIDCSSVTSSFSPLSSSYYSAPSTMSSLGEPCTQAQGTGTHPVGHAHCIVPMQTLSNPLQDMSQYMSNDWQVVPPVSPTGLDVTFKQEPYFSASPEIKPVPLHSVVAKKKAGRRPKKQTRRRRTVQTVDAYTEDGRLVETSFEDSAAYDAFMSGERGDPNAKRFPCSIGGCNAKFRRSEHQKRHTISHNEIRNFPCLVEGCEAGKAKNGSVNRNDNACDHAYTHIKAWLGAKNIACEIWGVPAEKKSKARNPPVAPPKMRRIMLSRYADQPEKAQKAFNTFNKKASAEFDIHIDFRTESCPISRCYSKRSGRTCRVCREIRGR